MCVCVCTHREEQQHFTSKVRTLLVSVDYFAGAPNFKEAVEGSGVRLRVSAETAPTE